MNIAGYVQIKDAAQLLGVSVGALRNWARAGNLVPVRHPINGYRLYRRADLDALMLSINTPSVICGAPSPEALA